MDAINTAIQTLNTQMAALVVPFGTLGLVVAIVAFLVTPLLPDWAFQMRGYIRMALLMIAFAGFVPAIVAGMAALGGGAATP